jgi:hypothetical protein
MSQQPHLPHIDDAADDGPVTCLGLTFPDDAARRAYFGERLAEHLQDPAFRQIEGFPMGADEEILALSDPPYYTACPNPFLAEIIAQWQQEREETRGRLGLPADGENGAYQREPFAADVSEGKNDPIYNAHSYHTKVPHKAIMRYILHYTDPGDIVFDGFCGTGMTGVAAQLCGDRKAVESLGYHVDPDGLIYDRPPLPPSSFSVPPSSFPISRLGARKAVLNDLSPAATFIAYNYNTPVDAAAFETEARRILAEVEAELGWMYETWHPHCDHPQRVKARTIYTVWSDVFICPYCTSEIVYYDVAMDQGGQVQEQFLCPQCSTQLSKRNLEHAVVAVIDPLLQQPLSQNKQTPVLISYSVGKRRYTKRPDDEDLQLIEKIVAEFSTGHLTVSQTFPMMLQGGENWGEIWRSGYHKGITHSHHFYTLRNYCVLSRLWQSSRNSLFRWSITAILNYVNKKQSFTGGGGGMPGVLYIASLVQEKNVFDVLARKIGSLQKSDAERRVINGGAAITTQSATSESPLLAESVDYIFVDPPFGGNIMYSEASFLWESWLRIFTQNRTEAIVSTKQHKSLQDYLHLMGRSFSSFHHCLKPGRWMTVEFHNSQNSIWNAIHEGILRAGFVIADVRTLDKQQASFKQVTSGGAVKQDLIISAYKPATTFERQFAAEAGTPAGAWDFVRQHLAQLPAVVLSDGALETIAERQDYLLFDRMVAFHIQRGATVPLSAAEFYAGLRSRFVERDGMFFLPDQVPAYDQARLQAGQVAQLTLFVNDEKSSLQWLRQQLDPALGGRPQTYQDLQPQFLRQLRQARHEELPELTVLLEQNFLQDGQGRWYVPDPHKASDLEALRHRALLREFRSTLDGKKRLKQFRTEAIRAGFAQAWRERDFAVIVAVAERLPEQVLQEDAELLMYYDNASLRMG